MEETQPYLAYEYMMQLKEQYMKDIELMDVEQMIADVKGSDETDTVTLFHGTSTAYLNSILEEGVLSRSKVQTNNWEHRTASLSHITYLTNKWHIYYAINANMTYLEKKYGKEHFMEHITDSFPCYVEIKAPKKLLITDEDFFLSQYMFQKMKSSIKKQKDFTFDWIECLANYGTVGVLGDIPPKYIVSFTVLGDLSWYPYVVDEQSPYHKDYIKWQKGKGKGNLRLEDLLKKEKQSDLNGTWWVKNLQSRNIQQIGLNEKTNRISIVVGD